MHKEEISHPLHSVSGLQHVYRYCYYTLLGMDIIDFGRHNSLVIMGTTGKSLTGHLEIKCKHRASGGMDNASDLDQKILGD